MSPLTQPLIIQAGNRQLTIRLDEDRESTLEPVDPEDPEDPEDPDDPEDCEDPVHPAHPGESSSSSSSDTQKEKETDSPGKRPPRKAASVEARKAALGMYYSQFSIW